MNAGNLFDGRERRPGAMANATANCIENAEDVIHRRCRRCEQERGSAATRVEIADSAKCFRRSLHRVAANRSVYMEIDKPGREIIATKIDNIICGCLRLLPDLRNFSLLRYDLQAFTNSVRENQVRVCENHAVNVQRPMPNVQRPIFDSPPRTDCVYDPQRPLSQLR